MGNKRRKYTKDFKKESVEYLIRSGKPGSKVAAELGIRQEILNRWKREYEQHEDKAFPGNGNPVFQQGSEMIFRLMKKHSDTYPVVKMAKTLGIRRSRYYRWLQTRDKRNSKKQKETILIAQIKDIQEDARYSLGTPRITRELQKEGALTNHKKVGILRESSLKHRMKKKFKVTTDSGHKHLVSPNLLN